MKSVLLVLSLLILCLPRAAAQVALAPAMSGLASGLCDSLVRVEITPRTSEGKEPHTFGWARRCPNCGRFHGDEAGEALKEKRALSWVGLLVAADEVVVMDPQLDASFVDSWHVSKGGSKVDATLAGISLSRNAIRLHLAKPLPATKPLLHFAESGEPAGALFSSEESVNWAYVFQPLGGGMLCSEDGQWQLSCPAGSLVLDIKGQVLGFSTSESLDSAGAWRRHPSSWDWIGTEAYQSLMKELSSRLSRSILTAHLRMRPLPVKKGRNGMDMDERQDSTQAPVAALVLTPTRVMLLVDLAPRLTARLESVELETEGRSIPATFLASSSQYGVLLVEPQSPLPQSVVLSTVPWSGLVGALLPAARLRFATGGTTARLEHRRISTLKHGYLGMPVPELSTNDDAPFIFDLNGALVGFPVSSRSTTQRNRWESNSQRFYLHASALTPYLGELTALSDSNNVPVSAQDARRKPWLGVGLQMMDEELARSSGTLEILQKGEPGALVTHIYPESPAARMKLQVGDVVLRIHPAGEPMPLKVELEGVPFADGSFPWDKYDQLPEAYYDQIPEPWQRADGRLMESLRDIGFGRVCTLDFIHAGHLCSAEFTIESGPADYESMPQESFPGLGLGLKELSYDTRHYLQLDATASGLIAASVQPGGLASVAGIKPYEVLVSANEKPLKTAADLKEVLASQSHIALVVRRLHQTRIVVIEQKQ